MRSQQTRALGFSFLAVPRFFSVVLPLSLGEQVSGTFGNFATAAVAIFNSRKIFHYILRWMRATEKKKLHTNEYLMWNIDDAALGICAHWRNFAAIFSPFPPHPRIACFVPATNDTMAAHTASVFWSLNNRNTKTNNNKKNDSNLLSTTYSFKAHYSRFHFSGVSIHSSSLSLSLSSLDDFSRFVALYQLGMRWHCI